jgi:D-glycero-D-manno-heptose 1,7-bisphosphate phosphatase
VTNALSGPVVFIDRDGTINQKATGDGYITGLEDFRFLPGAKEGLRLLSQAGAAIFVVTNQRGIARGMLTEARLDEIHRVMVESLADAGAHIWAVYHCPHERGVCDCRKPGSGMFRAAMRDFPWIKGRRTFVIGDSESDVEAAARLGWPAIRLSSVGPCESALHTVRSLLEAAVWLTAGEVPAVKGSRDSG